MTDWIQALLAALPAEEPEEQTLEPWELWNAGGRQPAEGEEDAGQITETDSPPELTVQGAPSGRRGAETEGGAASPYPVENTLEWPVRAIRSVGTQRGETQTGRGDLPGAWPFSGRAGGGEPYAPNSSPYRREGAGISLYGTLRRVQAAAAYGPGRTGTAETWITAAEAGEAGGPGKLDRAYQRDARRYDGGFPLY